MARRRKASTSSAAVKKPATRRSTRKTNGLPEDNPNGSVNTVDAEEEEDSPPSEEKPSSHSPQPSPSLKEAGDTPATTVVHKKFGKINCMMPEEGQNQSSPEPEEHIPSLQQPLHVEGGATIPVRRRTRASIQDARMMVEMVLLQEEQAANQITEEEEVIEEIVHNDEDTVIVEVNQEEIVYTEEVSATVWQAEAMDVEMYENVEESEDTRSQDEKVTEDESENCANVQEETLEQPLAGECEDSNDQAESVKNLSEVSNLDQERSTSTTSFSNHFHSSLDSDTSDKEMDEDESLRNKLSPDEITQMVLGMNCGNVELNVEHQLCKRQEEPEVSRLNNGEGCNSVPSSKSEPVGPSIGTISRQKNSTQSGSAANRDKPSKPKDSKSAVIPLNSVKTTPPRKHVICIDDSPIKSPDKLNLSQSEDRKDSSVECGELPLSSIADNLFSSDMNLLNDLSIRREEEDKPMIKQRQRLLDEDSFHTKKNSGSSDVEPERKRMGSFRSRSGSSDTTGSDSGSGSPSVRRSTRVRTSATLKHSRDSKLAVENSDSGSENPPSNLLPTVLGSPTAPSSLQQDVSVPVKVKSRWRRSSELEMGGIRPLDPESGAPPLQPSSPQADCPTSPCAPCSPKSSPPRDSSESKVFKQSREEELREIDERLRNYEILRENQYLTERIRSKGEKRMVCDCTLTKEEFARGEMGCGEDCLNRLLMIECGSRCAVKDRCSNKRFQNAEYASCEIFKTEKKGLGLRAVQDLPAGTFIMEYVGEVLDPREFRKRAKEYSKDQNRHYYFMALKSDAIIDATTKGNNSRFINHSCDPNSETQKWTVNGELRIGFFTTKTVGAGEEITFDYQFQRYGKEAQRCFCESTVCRGWIGGEPDKDKSKNQWQEWKEKDTSSKKKKDKDRDRDRDRERDTKRREDMDLEEEIEKLCSSGLKSRAHTLTLCRLMVRAEDAHSRSLLLRLLRDGEPACRRLFLDYHGLRLIWSWMIDTNTAENIQAKTEILRTLRKLPIPNKTMLMDSKVWSVVDRWTELKPKLCNPVPPAPPNSALIMTEKDDRTSAEEESSNDVSEKSESVEDKSPDTGDENTKTFSPAQNLNTPAAEKMELNEAETKPSQSSMLTEEGGVRKLPEDITAVDDVKPMEIEIKQDLIDGERTDEKKIGANEEVCSVKAESNEEFSPEEVSCAELAALLLQDWAALKEVFRIPKKERIEQMKEHEREADQHYSELDRDTDRQSYERHDRYDRYRDDRRKRSRESPDHDRRSRPRIEERRDERSRYEDRRHDDRSRYEGRSRYGENVRHDDGTRTEERPIDVRLSKEARRKAFALKVQQEEEEREARRVQAEKEAEEQKQAQEEWWRYHEERCRQLGLDPHVTAAIFHTQYFDPLSNQWVPYAHPPDPNCPPGQFPPEMGPHPHVYPQDPNNPIPPQLAGSPFPGIFPSLPGHPGLPGQPGQPVPFDPNHLPPGVSPGPPPGVLPGLPPGVAPGIQEAPTTEPGVVPLPSVTQATDPQQPVYPEDPFSRPQDPVLPAFPLADSQQQQQQSTPLSPSQIQQQQQVPVPYIPIPVPVKLPPKWKSAKDAEGRTYYYHVKTRISQWEPPPWIPAVAQAVESESSSTSSDEENDEDDDDSESSEEEDKLQEEEEEEREEEEDEDEAADEGPAIGLGMAAHHQQQMRADPDYPNFSPRPSAAEERKKRRVGLVQEHIISPRREEDRTNPKVYKEIKEKLRRQKEKRRQKEREGKGSKRRHRDGDKLRTSHSLEKPVTVAADTSSDAARRIKDQFRLNMAGVIVQHLNPYRKPDCRIGRITNTEDFKHLARKLTHFVMLKELKHCRNVDDLECNDNVKHKARDFIKKYMAKFGEIYQRPKDDD